MAFLWLLSEAPAAERSATDPYATNWFGCSFSEPIYSGYVFVKGKYIDAPYVVEQRGFALFINGVFIENSVNPRLVYPDPPKAPVTEDPGFPADLTATNGVIEAMCTRYEGKGRYFNY